MKQGIATGNTEKPQYQQPMWSNTFLTAQNVHFFSLHKNIFSLYYLIPLAYNHNMYQFHKTDVLTINITSMDLKQTNTLAHFNQ